MKHLLYVALTAGFLVGCGPKATTEPEAARADAVAEVAAPTGACTAQAAVDWEPAPGAKYVITGAAGGPTCNTGRAVLTIRDAATQKILLVSDDNDVSVMSNTVFSEAQTPESLKTALISWIDPGDDPMLGTAKDLPEWRAGQEQPSAGEFPFYPHEGMTREQYAALRAADKPLYCHVQGGESMACYVLDAGAGTLTDVGLQTFPG